MLLGAAFGIGMIRLALRLELWAAATLWLIAHAVFHLWEVAVGICSPSVIYRFSCCHSPGFDWHCAYGVGLAHPCLSDHYSAALCAGRCQPGWAKSPAKLLRRYSGLHP